MAITTDADAPGDTISGHRQTPCPRGEKIGFSPPKLSSQPPHAATDACMLYASSPKREQPAPVYTKVNCADAIQTHSGYSDVHCAEPIQSLRDPPRSGGRVLRVVIPVIVGAIVAKWMNVQAK